MTMRVCTKPWGAMLYQMGPCSFVGHESPILGPLAPWWAKFGWLVDSIVHRFGLRSCSYLDPVTDDKGRYLLHSKIVHPTGSLR